MQATASYLPGSQKSVKWAPEMLVLFWETLQCNKRFRSFIIDSNRSHDFLVLCIFYAMEYRMDPSKQGVVRMCVFILQTMSAESTFAKSLNNSFEAQETLPQSIRLLKFRGSYADYLIMVCLLFHLNNTILTSTVNSHVDDNQQGEPRHCVSSTSDHPQQHRSLYRTYFSQRLLKGHSAFLFYVRAQLLVGERIQSYSSCIVA